MKKYFFALVFLGLGYGAMAQNKKTTVAYIFEDYIFENYTSVKSLNDEIKKKQETFQTEFNKLALEYQTANSEYQESLKNINAATSESLNSSVKKVQGIKEAAENYQRNSEKALQEFIGGNITRIKAEIEDAAKKVSNAKSITYILTRKKSDSAMNPNRIVLYVDESKSLNISDDVLKILNAAKK